MAEEVMVMKSGTTKNEDGDNTLKLSRTYDFEGEKISKLDFSGLENLTAEDMIQANKVVSTTGAVSIIPEQDLYYTLVIASRATGRPIEFFKALKPRDAVKVKNIVTAFFYGTE